MQLKKLPTRYKLALGLGVASFLILAILILKTTVNGRFERTKEPPVVVTTGTVKSGDTLELILSRHKIAGADISPIQKTLGKSFNLRQMMPNHRYTLVTSTSGAFKKFIYQTDPVHSFTVARSTMGVLFCTKEEKKTIWIEKFVSCQVSENLYKDLLKKGYDENFVANLVGDLADNIFAWRIDFFTEQRPGDQVNVLMEQEYDVGSDKPLWGGRGRILAAFYRGSGTKHKENQAFRYQAPGETKADYFDRDGNAVRKAFLRAPFTYSGFRISSTFSTHRFHPILRIYRPHHGTDYACRPGTSVASIGKGKVIFAGWKGAYGKCIDIRHSSKFVSRYGHLSKILVKEGSTVEQGQRIALSGSTGLSSGPHLHFEIHADGSPRNFLKMEFPSAKAVSAKNMAEFEMIRDELLERLKRSQDIASLNKNSSQAQN